MPVVSVGQKLPSIYLDRFQPVEGLPYRISVLDTNAIATEFHFIDVPSKNIKGSYQCIQGACCAAFGRRSQTYNLPIFVYRESNPRTTEGDILVWRLTAPQWKKFSDMAMAVDFKVYDILLVAQKRGYGMDLTYSAVTDVKLRDWWTPEQKEEIPQSVASFYQLGEASLVNPMSFNDWNQLLYDCGFDLQNMQWPGGQSPMSQGNARRTVGAAFSPPSPGVLPPVPVMGQFQQPQGVVGSGVSPIMQPPSSPPGVVPGLPKVAVADAAQPQVSPSLPATGLVPGTVNLPGDDYGGGGFLVPAGGNLAIGPMPVVETAVSPVKPATTTFGGLGASPTVPQGAPGVPLGTAPVIPQSAVQLPATSIPPVLPDVNLIPGQQEITMEEMEQLLS